MFDKRVITFWSESYLEFKYVWSGRAWPAPCYRWMVMYNKTTKKIESLPKFEVGYKQ